MPIENVSLGICGQRRPESDCACVVWSGPSLSAYRLQRSITKLVNWLYDLRWLFWICTVCIKPEYTFSHVTALLKAWYLSCFGCNNYHWNTTFVWSWFSSEGNSVKIIFAQFWKWVYSKWKDFAPLCSTLFHFWKIPFHEGIKHPENLKI